MKLSNSILANAVSQLDDVNAEFLKRLKSESHKQPNNRWIDVCKIIFGRNVCAKTIQRYSLQCRVYYKRYYQHIYNELLINVNGNKLNNVSKNCPKAKKKKCKLSDDLENDSLSSMSLNDDENIGNSKESEVTSCNNTTRNCPNVNFVTTESIVDNDSSNVSQNDTLSSMFWNDEENTENYEEFERKGFGSTTSNDPKVNFLSTESKLYYDATRELQNDLQSSKTKKCTNFNFILLKKNLTFTKQFWDKYWVGANISLRTGWIEEFYNIFKKVYPECPLAIQWHKCPAVSKRNGKTFLIYAICKHSSCRHFRFYCNEPIRFPHKDKVVFVTASKLDYDHSAAEQHSRFIKNEYRKQLAVELEKKNPTYVRMSMINQSNKKALSAGNLTDVPSLHVMQKIVSDERLKEDLDKNFNNYMR